MYFLLAFLFVAVFLPLPTDGFTPTPRRDSGGSRFDMFNKIKNFFVSPPPEPYNAPYSLDDATWRSRLTGEEFYILREAGTERPWTSPLNDEKREGVFVCKGCGTSLFSHETKFNSGTGWPSFFRPIAENAVVERVDRALGMTRTEVLCTNCGGHLGHVFNDGPRPTGLRYCMNGLSLAFIPKAGVDR